uniref:TCDD-inducible poly [ADP-ribose] polymerase n=1 Tax=Magallana gigas TaxID=29159 RepID=K1QZ96_MAGGI
MAHEFELIELEEKLPEFDGVKSAFFATLDQKNFNICNIYRIQNLALWNEFNIYPMGVVITTLGSYAPSCHNDHAHRFSYTPKAGFAFSFKCSACMIIQARVSLSTRDRKKSLAKKTGRLDERTLYHGTDSYDTCYGICTNNFDFRLSGKHATVLGKGSYFAASAKYSHTYTRGPVHLMFQAKILVGSYTKGSWDMTCPPKIPGEGHRRYDSCVDNTTNPSIFVVFDRNQCYPEYLISYKDKCSM